MGTEAKTENQNAVRAWLQRHGWWLYLAAVALLISLFAFGGSPFFPINEWSDPNCFLTVGRAMLDGKVMYRDIYEQKGPYVYFLHALAALISDRSFLGVWLMEIVNLFFSMLLIAKIVGVYGHKKSVCAVVATLIGASVAFSYAMSTGDSVEEFVSPLYLWLLYITVKNIKTEKEFSARQYLLIGVTAGIVFWSKFTVIGIYLGWFAYFVWRSIRRKAYREIGKSVLWIACGVLLATLPCLIYFLATGAFADWMQVYLYDNLFLYSPKGNAFKSVLMIFWTAIVSLVRNPQYNLFALFGVVWFAVKKKGEERWFLLWIFSIMTAVLFIGGKVYRYYGLPFYVFAAFGYVSVLELVEQKGAKLLKPLGAVCGALILASSAIFFVSNGHHHHIFKEREELAQYKIAAYIQQHGDDDPTLLNYGGLDNGFYLAADIIPHLRYFAELNIPMEEMHAEMARYLDEGLTDFVVYRLDNRVKDELSHENYQEVLRVGEWSREERVTYILYQKI
ncbi:MAG: glycosyltransferase family 39 protein [Clostridia bacterium]|nr:glycosyltransferase family 39 protein [Clostridia bacterium]